MGVYAHHQGDKRRGRDDPPSAGTKRRASVAGINLVKCRKTTCDSSVRVGRVGGNQWALQKRMYRQHRNNKFLGNT